MLDKFLKKVSEVKRNGELFDMFVFECVVRLIIDFVMVGDICNCKIFFVKVKFGLKEMGVSLIRVRECDVVFFEVFNG